MSGTPNGTASQEDPTAAIVRRPWSDWLVFLDKKGLFPNDRLPTGALPYEPPGTARPAVYEIGRLKPGDRRPEVLYVGKATGHRQGLRKRLNEHYTIDDLLYDQIVEALLKRYEFVVRFVLLRPGEGSEAERLERELRDRFGAARYPWNPR